MKMITKLKVGLLFPLLLLGAGSANAAMVGDVVYSKAGLASAPFNTTETFTIDTAGNYKATLVDFGTPTRFDVLAFAVLKGAVELKSFLITIADPQTLTAVFWADPGVYTATIAGDPGSLGINGLEISLFGAEVAYVPVPPAVWLLGSALAGLVVVARRKREAAASAA